MRKPTKKPLRFAFYLRCSSDDQSYGDFTTIDAQRQINREHIQQLGGELVAEYSDEGKTGTNLSRPGWKRMLADAGAKRFDAVVVTYMSRLARGEVYHVAEYLLKEEKVTVELVKENFTPDMVGQLHKSMTIMMDGSYCRQVSQWTRTKQAQMVKMGYHTGGMCPFGYMTETIPGMTAVQMPGGKVKPAPKRLIPHPEEAGQVKRAFEIFFATRSIADTQRYLRSVDDSRRWPMTLVRNFLENDRYRGVARFGEHVNYSAHEAIITEQLFDGVQELLKKPEALVEATALGHHAGRTLDPHFYYLRGIVYCQHCGGRMTPATATGKTGKVPYYECVQSAKGNKTNCPVRRVNANALHEAVIGEILRCAQHPSRLSRQWADSIKHIPQPTEAKEELARLRRNRRETEKKAARVVEAIKQVGALPALTQEVRQLEELATRQEAQIKELESSQIRRTISRPDAALVAGVWLEMLDLWEELSEEERTKLLRLVVQRVELSEKTRGTTWLCLAAHQEAPLPTLFSQDDDGKFVNRDSLSAVDSPLTNYCASLYAIDPIAMPLIVPPSLRRRRGNIDGNHALVRRIAFALAGNQPAKSKRHSR